MREPNRQAQGWWELAEHSNEGLLATGTTLGGNLHRPRLNSQLSNYHTIADATDRSTPSAARECASSLIDALQLGNSKTL